MFKQPLPNFEIAFTYLLPDDTEVDLEVRGHITPVTPAFTAGPPEKCYPEEGGEMEDVEVRKDGQKEWVHVDDFCKDHGIGDHGQKLFEATVYDYAVDQAYSKGDERI